MIIGYYHNKLNRIVYNKVIARKDMNRYLNLYYIYIYLYNIEYY